MAEPDIAISLSPQESKILWRLGALEPRATASEEDLVGQLTLPIEGVRGGLERLKARGLVVSSEEHDRRLELTVRGREALERGLPERRLLTALQPGPLVQNDARHRSGLDDKEFAAAIGQLRRAKALTIGSELQVVQNDPPELKADEELLGRLSQGPLPAATGGPRAEQLVRRGLIETVSVSRKQWSLSDNGRSLLPSLDERPSLSALTSMHLKSGAWRGALLRPYDVRARVPFLEGARRHEYLSWLREVEQLLIGLGFEEARGPLVETEFYNNDALFIPQNHPARTAQDVFFLKGSPGRHPEPKTLEAVKNAHEGRPLAPGEPRLSEGWGSPFDLERSQQLLLRSQTTPVSVRYLEKHPTPPFRMYSIGAVFRRESLDARHHIQFDQCEGVYGGKDVSLRDLLGLFTTVARELGVGEVKFKPAYFPFTEPSVEGYVRHPSIGWMEILPGGMFRPEVLRPLGIHVPVAAWGIGVMRLAMVALGINDIREIYANPLTSLSEARI